MALLDPLLDDSPPDEAQFIVRAFFARCRKSQFKPDGRISGWRLDDVTVPSDGGKRIAAAIVAGTAGVVSDSSFGP